MAKGGNAQRHWGKEFFKRRPLSYYSINKKNKALCHRIERAKEKELLLREEKEIING